MIENNKEMILLINNIKKDITLTKSKVLADAIKNLL